jgi:hypothetical protein
MSTFVLKDPMDFPIGTTVGVYLRTQKSVAEPSLGTPVGAAISTAVVAADSTLTFVGLQPGVQYTAWASTFGYADFAVPKLADFTEPSTPWDTMTVAEAVTNIASPATSVPILAGGVLLPASAQRPRKLTRIGFKSGTTAAGTPTAQWFAIVRRSDRRILARTVDDGATAWPADTVKELLLQGNGYTPPADIAVFLARCVTATTPPSMRGQTLLSATSAQMAAITADVLTTPPAEGTQLGALTPQAGLPYAYVR